MDKGAHFFQCDFQIHSPRDLNWDGPKYTSEEQRKEYATRFIAACRKAKLDAVAITDHHDLAFFRYLKSAAQEELDVNGVNLPTAKQLVVFPGMELTLGSPPCQALLILDADFPVADLQSIPSYLAISTNPESDKSTSHVEPLTNVRDFKELYDRLHEYRHLRGRFIIFPHVKDKGHKTLLRKGFQTYYRDMPCVGGYIDGNVDALGIGNKKITDGEDENYGFKSIGIFQTSDSRANSFKSLGSARTWVKWSKPTAEALRQACLAKETRIFHTQPSLPSNFISRIEISNSKFMGPVLIDLNMQFNAIIGGRGTGKSSLLEYVRWCLCDQPTFGEDGMPDFQKKRDSLIQKTIKDLNASVQVTIEKNGVQHLVRRTSDGKLMMKVASEDFRSVNEEEVHLLIPIHAYSQKQLSSIGNRTEELTRFVYQPLREKLEFLDEKISDETDVLRESFIQVLHYDRLSKEIEKLEIQKFSLEQQISSVLGEMPQTAIDETAIQKEKIAALEEMLLNNTYSEMQSSAEMLIKVRVKLTTALAALQKVSSTLSPRLFEALTAILTKECGVISGSIEALSVSSKDGKIPDSISKFVEKWKAERRAVAELYETMQASSSENMMILERSKTLETQKQNLEVQISEKRLKMNDFAEAKKEFHARWLRRQETLQSKVSLIDQECKSLTLLSEGLIKADVQIDRSFTKVREEMDTLRKGVNIRSNKVEALIEHLAKQENPYSSWLEFVNGLAALTSFEFEAKEVSGILALGFTIEDLQKLKPRITNDVLQALLCVTFDVSPSFKYRIREADYLEFRDASAGQQATALLLTLLNQSGPPLIVDQPEDDLDSSMIETICQRVWSCKSKRQLIFSSHNANLVVNGDADLVVVCDYRLAADQSGGQIADLGAIDAESVRNQITRIMEGGEKAFSMRKEKYGF